MTNTTRDEMINSLWTRLHETLGEIEGKSELRGTAWYDDRVELSQMLLARAQELEASD